MSRKTSWLLLAALALAEASQHLSSHLRCNKKKLKTQNPDVKVGEPLGKLVCEGLAIHVKKKNDELQVEVFFSGEGGVPNVENVDGTPRFERLIARQSLKDSIDLSQARIPEVSHCGQTYVVAVVTEETNLVEFQSYPLSIPCKQEIDLAVQVTNVDGKFEGVLSAGENPFEKLGDAVAVKVLAKPEITPRTVDSLPMIYMAWYGSPSVQSQWNLLQRRPDVSYEYRQTPPSE